MDNVGWGWSREKVRRGNDDPFSLLDVNNIDLSWQHTNIDENTKEEYAIMYEKGDIVITNGVVAENELQIHMKKVFKTMSSAKQGAKQGVKQGAKVTTPTYRPTWSSVQEAKKAETSTTSIASALSIQRIFVAMKSNTNSHPMSSGGQSNWKELRLNSNAWLKFVQLHFKHG
jgi:hypothetical protein